MSLLLDALKKAAKDKEQAKQADVSSGDVRQTENISTEDRVDDRVDNLTDDQEAGFDIDTDNSVDTSSEDFELELDDSYETKKPPSQTVSDEALQMLVYKTNDEYRKKHKRMVFAGLFTVLFVVGAAGYYFYSDMQYEIESVERKHRIALQQMRATDFKRTKPAYVASAADKVKPVVSNPVKTSKPKPVKAKPVQATVAKSEKKQAASSPVKKQENKTIHVSHAGRPDPVGILLREAYRAYQEKNYDLSKNKYRTVLGREPNNRDALLGLGAVAIVKQDYNSARQAYMQLLKLDPKDAIANAAMHNLETETLSTTSESKLKFLIRQQPESAPLYFALGNLYSRQQKWPEAQRAYFSAWEKDNKNADYVYNLAVSLDRINKKEQAEKFYRMSLDLADGASAFPVESVKQRLSNITVQETP